jgi:hypothetical protein
MHAPLPKLTLQTQYFDLMLTVASITIHPGFVGSSIIGLNNQDIHLVVDTILPEKAGKLQGIQAA